MRSESAQNRPHTPLASAILVRLERVTQLAVHAPELDGGLAWLNVDRPLTMKGLRGSVVILDFWTYCCVNCMHVLPVLRAVEEHFRGEPVVVIGVHSGKFTAEQDPARIREAVGRYEVLHPVVVDDGMSLWSRYAIRSWPTLVVVRPDGTLAAVAPGEVDFATLAAFIQHELDAAREKGHLTDTVAPALPPRTLHEPLCYPGQVTALPDGRIVVSDSGHHRLLVLSAEGDVLHTIGSGLRGLADGSLEQAAFDDPQGAAWYGERLYVADTRNHALRAVDLATGSVVTVAGTGQLGAGAPAGPVDALGVALRSPWGIAVDGDTLIVSMAGNHQLWRFSPAQGTLAVYAGEGVEALLDGPVERSAWAQPSGLCLAGRTLYVADSETSAVRAVDLDTGAVRTLIGEGLFDFGDEEGTTEGALLQHPLDVVALPDGSLLVADTYNGKLKRIASDQPGARVETVLSGLAEPGGVALLPDGAWLVADTNAHRLLRVAEGVAAPFEVRGAPKALVGSLARGPSAVAPPDVSGWFTALLALPEGPGLGVGEARVRLVLTAPRGAELPRGTSLLVRAEVSRRSDLLVLACSSFDVEQPGSEDHAAVPLVLELPLTILPLPTAHVEAELVVSVDYVACSVDRPDTCAPRSARLRVPVRLSEGGGGVLTLEAPLAG